MTARGALAIVGVACVVASCSAPGALPSPPSSDFAILVDSYLDSPEAEHFSAAQIATLNSARASGELSFEDYSTAIRAALECVADAGFYVDIDEPDMTRGFLTINYFYESPEAGNPVAEACLREHSSAVESVYQLQPVSVEAEAAVSLSRRADVLDCLERIGADEEVAQLTAEELSAEEFDGRLGRLILDALEVSEERALEIAECDA